jgi:hypothetical protein
MGSQLKSGVVLKEALSYDEDNHSGFRLDYVNQMNRGNELPEKKGSSLVNSLSVQQGVKP